MDEKILRNRIDLIESTFVGSGGGRMLYNLALEYYVNSSPLKLFFPSNIRLIRLIQREIMLRRIDRSSTVLFLSAFGPLFRPKFITYLYFQNIDLLESKSMKSILYQKYIDRFQKWDNCYVVLQGNWILEKYSNFISEKCIVEPLPLKVYESTPYFIYPTSPYKYKNNVELIKAFLNTNSHTRLLLTLEYEDVNIVDKRIVCIGKVHPEALKELYKNAEAILLCSEYESYSYPLYEASALEKLIIVKRADYAMCLKNTVRFFDTWEELIQIINKFKLKDSLYK